MKLKYLKMWYLRNRFITRTHMMPNRLPKGEFHEMHDRVLHVSFEALVDWIEIECALWHYVWRKEEPTWKEWFKFTFEVRQPELGLKYINWCINLDPEESPKHQIESAREALELYNWWKHIRPARRDAWDDPLIPGKMVGYEVAEMIEKEYLEEDQEMLCRLAKVLDNLWL